MKPVEMAKTNERDPIKMALTNDVVLDNVLKHLKVRDVLSCRQVSKIWNKAASSVLRRRSTMIRTISKTKALEELEECLKQSSDFPFAGLTFDQPWRLDYAGRMRFFENHGARFTRLLFNTGWAIRLQDLAAFTNYLPRMSLLEVSWSAAVPPPVKLSDSAAGHEDDKILNLRSLRTLRIDSVFNEDFLREIFTATSSSVRIECLRTSYGTLGALKNAGKLQAVSIMEVKEAGKKERDKLRVDELLSTTTPALTKLNFEDGGCISRKELIKLLISSQHTLKTLSLVDVCPSELLSECPVLAKLTTLSVSNEEYWCFQGSHGHKFPGLTELKLCAYFECPISDGLFIVPTVTKIHLDGYVGTQVMKELAQTFPNVVAIGLNFDCYNEYEHFTGPGEYLPSEIWSVGEFKQLDTLRIWDFVSRWSTKNYLNMDSFLTGIPVSICKNLQQQGPELMLNLIKSPFGEKFSEVIRESPNILQLKNLKELIVSIRLKGGLEGIPKEPTFMSMVSVLYALEMMPNLKAKFVYEYSLLREYFHEEDREEAVTLLQAAFKDVQPYVKLEPFFY